jgi:hypothetical protein
MVWRVLERQEASRSGELFPNYLTQVFLLCVHTHLYLTSDCHNLGWWMHWLDELSLYTCRSAPATTLGSGPRNAATVFRHSVSTLTTPFHWRVVWLDALSVSTPVDMTTGTQMTHKHRHTHSQIHTYAYACLCLCAGALASTYALPTRVERRMLRFNHLMHPGGYPPVSV